MSRRTSADELRRIRASRASEPKVPYQPTGVGSDKRLTSVGPRDKSEDDKADKKELLAHFSC